MDLLILILKLTFLQQYLQNYTCENIKKAAIKRLPYSFNLLQIPFTNPDHNMPRFHPDKSHQ